MAIVRMTMQEIEDYAKKNRAKLDAMYKKAKPEPYIDDGIPPKGFRGLAKFMEHINRGGRPKIANKKVVLAIRFPEDIANQLRQNKRYSSHVADYVIKGLSTGKLKIPKNVHK